MHLTESKAYVLANIMAKNYELGSRRKEFFFRLGLLPANLLNIPEDSTNYDFLFYTLTHWIAEGRRTVEELAILLREMGLGTVAEEVKNIEAGSSYSTKSVMNQSLDLFSWLDGENEEIDEEELKRARAMVGALPNSSQNLQTLLNLFCDTDLDGDGKLTPDEFCELMHVKCQWPKNVAKKILNEYDRDKDGELDKPEFVKIFLRQNSGSANFEVENRMRGKIVTILEDFGPLAGRWTAVMEEMVLQRDLHDLKNPNLTLYEKMSGTLDKWLSKTKSSERTFNNLVKIIEKYDKRAAETLAKRRDTIQTSGL